MEILTKLKLFANYTSGQPVLHMECLGGTEISWLWTKCTWKVTKLLETQCFL